MSSGLFVLFALFFGIVIMVLIKLKEPAKKRASLDKVFILKKWQEIKVMMDMQTPTGYTSAILEADKLVDYVLKARIGTNGTMGDRLKKGQKLFSKHDKYNNLWYAHKTRNRIAHETDHGIYFAEAKKVIGFFEDALRDLSVL